MPDAMRSQLSQKTEVFETFFAAAISVRKFV